MSGSGQITQVRLATSAHREPVNVEWQRGRITAITGGEGRPTGFGGTGLWLLPGLFDLHCDTLERVVEPRPGVHFDFLHSLQVIDRRLLSAGITTVYHALSIAGEELGLRSPQMAQALIAAIREHRPRLSINHRVHLRFETSHLESIDLVRELIENGSVDLLSFMDHTPGQGQFPNEAAYMRYLMLTYGRTERQAREILRQKSDTTTESESALRGLASIAREARIPLAAHDLDDPRQVSRFRHLGATLSEFPLNLETAKASREGGLNTLFGSPNVVRGESSGQGMRAVNAVEAGVADALCSDYAPETLLPALGRLVSEPGLNPQESCALGSTAPARLLGDPRSCGLAPGAPADFILVEEWPSAPRLIAAWVDGHLKAHWPRPSLNR